MTSPGHRSPGHGGRQPPPGTGDIWPLRRRHSKGYRGTLILPRGPGLWPTPPAGTATAAPTSALTADRAPWTSWPTPSTLTSAAGARSFLQDKGHFHGDQGPRSTTLPVSNGCSGSPGASVTRCNDNEEDRRLLDLRPHLLGVAAQGAQLLLRQVPRAASPLSLQEAQDLDIEQITHPADRTIAK